MVKFYTENNFKLTKIFCFYTKNLEKITSQNWLGANTCLNIIYCRLASPSLTNMNLTSILFNGLRLDRDNIHLPGFFVG